MPRKPSILLTGDGNYIGRHTLAALPAAGYTSLVLHEFSNSDPSVLARSLQSIGLPP